MKFRPVLVLAVFVSACVQQVPRAAPLPPRIILADDGLKIADSGGQEIGFDRTQAGVVTAISRLVGSGPASQVIGADCTAQTWENGLTLYFIDDAFVGWTAGAPVWSSPPRSAGKTCGGTGG